MSRLNTKTAIITGGTSGIGRDAVVRFAKEGAKVLFTGRDAARAQETIEMVQSVGGQAWFEQQDVNNEGDWQRVMASAKKHLGEVDVLVNCAGIFIYNAIENTSVAEFKTMWRVNVDGTFLGTKYAMQAMQDNEHGGSIVNIASLSGLVGHPHCVSYCSSKAGSIMLSRVAALEAGPKIRVNAIAPGPVWNELLENAHQGDDAGAMKEYYRTDQPLKILGLSEDVTNGIIYLASNEAKNVTGMVLRIDAGRGAD